MCDFDGTGNRPELDAISAKPRQDQDDAKGLRDAAKPLGFTSKTMGWTAPAESP
jgi:hypothetical protein